MDRPLRLLAIELLAAGVDHALGVDQDHVAEPAASGLAGSLARAIRASSLGDRAAFRADAWAIHCS